MSYDFHLVPGPSSQNPLSDVHAFLERDEEEINPGPPIAEKEEKKRGLCQLLMDCNPNLKPFEFGYSEIAAKYNWTEEEARVRFRHVELNGPDDSNGIQITLYDDAADITVPYWHQPDEATAVIGEIWQYLTILTEDGGLVAYDPQLDRILDLSTDRSEVLKRYGGVVAKIPDIVGGSAPPKKPWWRFW
jgi:hypothetical protein